MRDAEVGALDETVTAAAGLAARRGPPLARHSAGVDVSVLAPELVAG